MDQNVLLSNKITGLFFEHQFTRKEATSVSDVLHRDSNQEKIACKTATAGWV